MTARSLIVGLAAGSTRRWISLTLLSMLLVVTLTGYRWSARRPAIDGPIPVRIPIEPPGWHVEPAVDQSAGAVPVGDG